jgi:competence protein ComEC
LHPNGLTGDKNEDSLVLLLELESVSFLFTGDIQSWTEAELLKLGCLTDIDVLKVAHHGSKFGSSTDFLDATKPELAIYSASVKNPYGHPT